MTPSITSLMRLASEGFGLSITRLKSESSERYLVMFRQFICAEARKYHQYSKNDHRKDYTLKNLGICLNKSIPGIEHMIRKHEDDIYNYFYKSMYNLYLEYIERHKEN